MTSPTVLIRAPGETDHIRGGPDFAVTLVEYGDFECPACARFAKTGAQLRRRFGGHLRFVFRHFPVSEKHPHALLAAQAAQAAGFQGKFWEMHELLFANQRALGRKDLLRYAQELGLNTATFERDLADESVTEDIKESLRDGLQSGVTRTPGLFINGRLYDGDLEATALGWEVEKRLVGPAVPPAQPAAAPFSSPPEKRG